MKASVRKPVGSGSLRAFVGELVDSGAVVAAAAIAGGGRRHVVRAALGRRSDGASHSLPAGALFDLASLTKILSTTLALRLDQSGALPLDLPIGEIWSNSPIELGRLPLEDLLRHRARFRAWTPLYARCREPAGIADVLLSGELLEAKRGTYSDLGVILWGLAVERVVGRPLLELIRSEVAVPLRLRGLAGSPVDGRRAVRCPLDNGREIELAAEQGIRLTPQPPPSVGVAQDGNARFLGRSAAHAGLFATATDLWKVGLAWLQPTGFLTRASIDRAWSGSGSHVLGWRRSRARGAGDLGSGSAIFGHTGFTGGSLEVDPARERVLVLLTHRSSISVDLEPWRRRFRGVGRSIR